MITLKEVLQIHQIAIDEFGGAIGIRDEGILQSAIARPFNGFGDSVFYPEPAGKAAAILESIVKNHPFVDGNKRTGYLLMRLIMMNYDKDIKASQEEKYDFVIKVASSQIEFDEIVTWIKEHEVFR